MADPIPSPLQCVRAICLSLPEAQEKPFGGHEAPSFRVRDKLFVMTYEDHSAMTMKAPPGEQEALVDADPDTFFRPPYVGHKGWVGVRFRADNDWDELTEMITESYRMTAPKRLSAMLEAD